MEIKAGDGITEIALSPGDISRAIDAFLVVNGVYTSGSRYIRLNGIDHRESSLCVSVPSPGYVNTRNKVFHGNGAILPYEESERSDPLEETGQ